MGYVISRVFKAVLITVSDNYIDYKKEEQSPQFYFANIDKKDFKEPLHYTRLMKKLRTAIKRNTKVNLVLERRPGKPNKKQFMDYVIGAEFW